MMPLTKRFLRMLFAANIANGTDKIAPSKEAKKLILIVSNSGEELYESKPNLGESYLLIFEKETTSVKRTKIKICKNNRKSNQ